MDPMAEYNMPQYILREFKVTDARVSGGGSVCDELFLTTVFAVCVCVYKKTVWFNQPTVCVLIGGLFFPGRPVSDGSSVPVH